MIGEELLLEFAAWRDFRAREAEYEQRAASIRDKALMARREWDEKHTRWQEAVRAAVKTGDLPPAPPPPLDEEAGRQVEALLRAEGEQIRADQNRTLSLLVEPVRDLVNKRWAERADALRTLVAVLEAACVETQNDIALLRQATLAAQAEMTEVPRPSPAERLRTSITVETLVDAIATESSLMEPEPLPSRKRSTFDSDDPSPLIFEQRDDGVVRLGLQSEGKGAFGRRPPDWPKTAPPPSSRLWPDR